MTAETSTGLVGVSGIGYAEKDGEAYLRLHRPWWMPAWSDDAATIFFNGETPVAPGDRGLCYQGGVQRALVRTDSGSGFLYDLKALDYVGCTRQDYGLSSGAGYRFLGFLGAPGTDFKDGEKTYKVAFVSAAYKDTPTAYFSARIGSGHNTAAAGESIEFITTGTASAIWSRGMDASNYTIVAENTGIYEIGFSATVQAIDAPNGAFISLAMNVVRTGVVPTGNSYDGVDETLGSNNTSRAFAGQSQVLDTNQDHTEVSGVIYSSETVNVSANPYMNLASSAIVQMNAGDTLVMTNSTPYLLSFYELLTYGKRLPGNYDSNTLRVASISGA